MLVAKYGAEALEHLRQAQPMLKAVAALSRLEQQPWTLQVEEWERLLNGLVALMEDTPLDTTQPRPTLALRELLAQAMQERRTVTLCVERLDGTVESVLYEPYSIKVSPRQGEMLFAFHVAHDHLERLPLSRIRYLVALGEQFQPRWDIEAPSGR